jgi:Ribosomal protein S20
LSKIINYFIDHQDFALYTIARMANTKSAIKTNRRVKRQTLVNRSRRSKYKAAIKKINSFIEKKDKKEALKLLPKLNSQLMRVAKTGIVKKKNASRNISRITKKINSL